MSQNTRARASRPIPLQLKTPGAELPGDLVAPEEAGGVVVFVHGSGSSRHSSRNREVAAALQERGFATVLFDLLTEAEDRTLEARFDIDLLTRRIVAVTSDLRQRADLADLPFAYFGASTGAAAALRAAASEGARISAVVSRGGRPDLAIDTISGVRAATLLLVGSLDTEVLRFNQQAYVRLRSLKKLVVVPGASHLFEEPGTLEQVASLAGNWFQQYAMRASALA